MLLGLMAVSTPKAIRMALPTRKGSHLFAIHSKPVQRPVPYISTTTAFAGLEDAEQPVPGLLQVAEDALELVIEHVRRSYHFCIANRCFTPKAEEVFCFFDGHPLVQRTQ